MTRTGAGAGAKGARTTGAAGGGGDGVVARGAAPRTAGPERPESAREHVSDPDGTFLDSSAMEVLLGLGSLACLYLKHVPRLLNDKLNFDPP